MKKITLALLANVFLLPQIFCVSLQDIFTKAKSSSNTYRNLQALARQSDFNALLSQYDKQDNYNFSIDSTLKPKTEAGDSSLNLYPSLSFESGNDNTTSVKLTSPINIMYASDSNRENSYEPAITLGQKFIVDGVKDIRSDLAKQKSRLQAENLINKTELQFMISVCNYIIQILQKESDWLVKTTEYKKNKAFFDSQVSSNAINEGEYSYSQSLSDLISYENLSIKANNAYISALNNFKNLCGFDYEEIDEMHEPELNFQILENGNTNVAIAYIDKLSAENQYEVLTKNNSRAININATGELDITGRKIAGYQVGIGTDYKDSDWTAGVLTKINVDNEKKTSYPEISFSLSYNLGSNQSQIDRLNNQNALITKENKNYDYENALFDYLDNARTMQMDIISAKLEAQQRKQIMNNNLINFENINKLNEKGYYSEYEYAVESANFKKTQNDYKIFILNMVILQCNADILNF